MLALIGRLPNLTHVRYFLAVCENMSFRQASEQLHIAQPAVTRAVQLLEAEVGYKLLDRTTRRVALTPAGAHLRKEAGQALAHLAAAIRDARQFDMGNVGELTVAYAGIASSFSMNCVTEFRSAYPDAHVITFMRTSEECSTLLEAGHIDVAFMLTSACPGHLLHRSVLRQDFVAVMPEAHPLSGRDSLRLAELADCGFILGGQSRMRVFASLVERACQQAGFSPKVVGEANDTALLLHLVAQGRGVTLFSPDVSAILPAGVKIVPLKQGEATIDLSLAWSPRRETPLVKKFLEHVGG